MSILSWLKAKFRKAKPEPVKRVSYYDIKHLPLPPQWNYVHPSVGSRPLVTKQAAPVPRASEPEVISPVWVWPTVISQPVEISTESVPDASGFSGFGGGDSGGAGASVSWDPPSPSSDYGSSSSCDSSSSSSYDSGSSSSDSGSCGGSDF